MARELTFRSPGFFEREIDESGRKQEPFGVAAGVIGAAQRGPAFIPIVIGPGSDFIARFGNVDPKYFGPYAVKEFLKHKNAVAYLRVLGAGANATVADIAKTRVTDQVKNAGFVTTGTLSADTSQGGQDGATQFIVAQHAVSTNEAFGSPMFTDNDSVSSDPYLVRGMVLLASGTRLLIADGDSHLPTEFASTDSKDDTATINASAKFKLIISSTLGAAFSTTDNLPGLRVFTASLSPTNDDYFGKLLNVNSELFPSEHHLLYADFAVDEVLASASWNAGAIGVVSGSTAVSSDSGDTSMLFRDVYGHFDTRYQPAYTPYLISQPFGTAEFDLFKIESIDDGAYANDKIKISISNIRKSTDPNAEFGVFSVVVRQFTDTDTDQIVLERYPDVNLDPDSDRFVARVIGNRKVYYNFDAESDNERRLIIEGTYPNKSRYIRIILSNDLSEGNIPKKAIPFGFRGYELLKTTDTLTDGDPGSNLIRLSGNITGSAYQVTQSILPPIPYRFKCTRGSVAVTGYAGNPGPTEIVNSNLHWGVKFERATDALNPNVSEEANRIIAAYSKLHGLKKLDSRVTGSGADTFNHNKFTLARVALACDNVANITASADDHMREASYIRNGKPDPTNYSVDDGVWSNRVTLGTLVALTSSIEFNKFNSYNKFNMFMANGFDGVNILDKNANRLNDKATSFDTDGGAASTFLSPGLAVNANGTEKTNNIVQSYRVASKIMTDEISSNINLLAIPGIRETYITDYAALRVRSYGLAMYVMDLEEYDYNTVRLFDDSSNRPDVDKTADQFDSRAIDNNYAATYFPSVQIDDDINHRRVTVPASVAAYGALAFNDRIAYPWFAPAGFNRAALDFVKNVKVRLNSADRDRLQDARINPIATFPRSGFVIFGQKTLQYAKSALDRVNVRRLLVEVKRVIKGIAARLTFEANVSATRISFTNKSTLQLALIQSQAGIEKFKVVMDSTNNTDEDAENNLLNGCVEVTPTKAIEAIQIDFIITNSGVEFR